MIHVCFALYDKTGHFSKFAGTAMLSLFENIIAPPYTVTVHILHDNTLTLDSRDKFSFIAGRYGQLVKFYNVEEHCGDKIEEIKSLLPQAVQSRFSIAMYYRFFISYVLPPNIDKIIYLDADLVVNLDINELWQIELNEKILGVVPVSFQKLNEPVKDYFNSGVLLINVPAFRKAEKTLNDAIKFMSENPKYEGNDQEILNYCFAKNALKMPMKFNRLVKWCRYYNETRINKMIYHFNSHNSLRGLGLDINDPFNQLWMSYFIRTPFFDETSIGRLFEGFKKVRDDLIKHRLKLTSIVSGKTRAFFIEPEKIKEMKKFFHIQKHELIIPAENADSLQKLIDAMKDSQGKKIFFILTKNFMKKDFPIDVLVNEGFADPRDFIKGWNLFSEEHGMLFNTNSFIQEL